MLRASPFYLAEGRDDTARPVRLSPGMVPFPSRADPITLGRHEQLARQFVQLAHQDGRASGDWLRRLAREPTVNPWLLLDQLSTMHAHPRPAPRR